MSFSQGNHTLKWAFDNDFELIFVAVYLNISKMFYIDNLLEVVKKEFIAMFKDDIRACKVSMFSLFPRVCGCAHVQPWV